jgi:hypothetical protein
MVVFKIRHLYTVLLSLHSQFENPKHPYPFLPNLSTPNWSLPTKCLPIPFKHISSPLCSCLSEIESIDHFLLRCLIFSTHRVPLIHSVLSLNRICPLDLHVLTQSKQLLIALNYFTVDTNRLNTIQTNTQHNTRQM